MENRTVFSGIESIARRRSALIQLINGPNPLEIKVQGVVSPTVAIIDGRRTTLFGTNNYLGLTFNPAVREAAVRAIWQYGVGTTASRVASGNLPDHYELERELAVFLKKRSAVVFSTGFQANLGAIAGLCGPGTVVLLDEDCHASIYDAAALSAARKSKFRHNDLDHLRHVLSQICAPRSNVLIVVEAIYSALGDAAPLTELVDIKNEYGCKILVDEAHSIGMFGPKGSGRVAELDLSSGVEILTGTFSKSFGLLGGFAASDHPDFDCLRYSARSFMFTAALPPTIVAAARESLKQIGAADTRRACLWDNVRRLRKGLRECGFAVPDVMSPVVSVILSDLTKSYMLWRSLLEGGYYANLLLPPATPRGACVLRFSVCSEHTPNDIDGLLNAITTSSNVEPVAADHSADASAFTSSIGIVVPTAVGAGSAK